MSDLQRLAETLQDAVARISALESSGTGLGHSSFDRGAITQYKPGSAGGLPTARFGQQDDGTYGAATLGGPTPPSPTNFTVTGGVERAVVNWSGDWIGGPLPVPSAPLDFSRVEIHAWTTPDFSGIDIITLRLPNYESPRGGEISIVGLTPDTDYWFRLTARTQAGKFATSPEVVGPVRATKLTVENIDLSEIGGNTIHRGPSEPIGDHKIGDLWLQTPDNIAHRWEGDPGSWVESADQRVATALDEAFAANETANQAGVDALAALGAAQSAQTTATSAADSAAAANTLANQAKTAADSKITVYR